MTEPVVLLLAAGESRRFGTNKLLQMLPEGCRLIDHMIAQVLASGLKLMVVTDRRRPLSVQADCLEISPDEPGMGASIAAGVTALQPTAMPACLILPADLPLLRPDTLMAVANAARPDSIVRPVTCDGIAGHPVAFGRAFFPELSRLDGESGANAILQSNLGCVLELTCDDPGIHQDVDTPEAWQSLIGPLPPTPR